MNDGLGELVHKPQPLKRNTCMAEETSESMAQRFAGIFYLLEVEEAAVAGGTPGYLAQAKEAAREGIREAMRVLTCRSSNGAQCNVAQRAVR